MCQIPDGNQRDLVVLMEYELVQLQSSPKRRSKERKLRIKQPDGIVIVIIVVVVVGFEGKGKMLE